MFRTWDFLVSEAGEELPQCRVGGMCVSGGRGNAGKWEWEDQQQFGGMKEIAVGDRKGPSWLVVGPSRAL